MSEEQNPQIKKVPFETRIKRHPNGSLERKIYIDGEMFDWSVDITSFKEAQRMGPVYQKAVKEDIAKHFIESVSDVLGRKITMQEIMEATKTGWI